MNIQLEDSHKLDIIGIPIVEHCNLNCKGCLHFCHHGQNHCFYNIEQFRQDLRRLHDFFYNITIIRLYGGEPLLHPLLADFIFSARKEFPNAQIELLTNGLLLDTLNTKILVALRKARIKICWSIYPIMSQNKVKTICCFLKQQKLEYSSNLVDTFYVCLNLKGNSLAADSFAKCNGKHCHILRNGKISTCPAPLIGHYINELGGNIDFTDGILDLNTQKLTSEQILTFLNLPHSACKYCGPPQYFSWQKQQDFITLDDWCIK